MVLGFKETFDSSPIGVVSVEKEMIMGATRSKEATVGSVFGEAAPTVAKKGLEPRLQSTGSCDSWRKPDLGLGFIQKILCNYNNAFRANQNPNYAI